MKNISILSKFDMELGKGLVWVSEPNAAANDYEVLAIEEARKHKADAIYFRRSENLSSSVPQVYIYEREFSEIDLVETHTNLWSSGVVPFFYIVTSTQIKIFNCTQSVKNTEKGLASDPLKVFSFIGDLHQKLEYQKYSAKLFDNGTFWEEHKEILNVANSPYQKLLVGLLRAKKDLEDRKLPLVSSTISKLLIIGVLVRYLEEKEDLDGIKLLEINRDFYHKFPESNQFTDILRNGQIIPFLDELKFKFNGKIFDLKPEEREELSSRELNLDYIAFIFDADIEGRQFVLWKLYAFNHLPIELISGIYEAFLKKEKGVVYTPPYLVNALIDECMPLDKAEYFFANEEFKVLDPACGSGIFLVAALKRMVQWKAILHYKSTGKVAYPDIETIKRITKNNIFGVDIEEGATLISIFSLCIALCDKLSPMQIWHHLRFDDLSQENIRTSDVFKIYREIEKERFDLVIGNPPFNPPTGYNNKSYLKYVKEEYQIEPSHPLNDDNIALLFWDRAIHLRKPGGKICFILPAGAWLYNNNAFEYRKHSLKNFQVSKIIDFTHISDKLFHGKANVAVCATIATDQQAEPHDLLHIIVRRSKVAEERFFFEIDHYDFHQVSYKTAVENPLVWKSNLLGGGRLLRLVNYLNTLRSLGEFLAEMKQNYGWEYGEGYIIGHDGKLRLKELTSNGRTRKFYDNIEWITGKKTVGTETFDESGYFKTFIEDETHFEWPRTKTKAIFSPPHILIKENLGKERIPMIFSEEYLCFKHEIIGIHSPQSGIDDLREVCDVFRKYAKTHRFLLLSSSSRAGISRSNSTLLKKDIMNLPFPENQEDLQLGYSETIIQNDVLNFYIKSSASSDNSPLNEPATEKDLADFGEVFCKILNPIYEQNGQEWFVHRFQSAESVVAYVFCFGKPKPNILPNIFDGDFQGIEKLLFNTRQRNVRITRVLREYLHIDGYDVLVMIKPKSLRYWLKSIALRDADETFADLKRTGF